MRNIGIVGYGEIGQSIHNVYKDYNEYNIIKIEKDWRDKNQGKVEILNITLPYSSNFSDIVIDYINEYDPNLCIIHSTTLPGTTEMINNRVDCSVVHSPVRGVHPNLYEGILTFIKYIGYCDELAKEKCERHFDEIGLNYKSIENPSNTELAKLYSTTYYGLCIAFHGEMKKHFDSLNLDYDIITKWNESYNEGYRKLDKENVVRPVLIPPTDFIGGHCVIQNTELLSEIFNSEAFNLILKYKELR